MYNNAEADDLVKSEGNNTSGAEGEPKVSPPGSEPRGMSAKGFPRNLGDPIGWAQQAQQAHE